MDQDALANDCPELKLLVTSVLIDSPILALAQPVNIIDGITRPIVADKQVLVAQHSINLINCKLNIVESLQEYNTLIVDTKQCFLEFFLIPPFFPLSSCNDLCAESTCTTSRLSYRQVHRFRADQTPDPCQTAHNP